jgi:hypothetical protein
VMTILFNGGVSVAATSFSESARVARNLWQVNCTT